MRRRASRGETTLAEGETSMGDSIRGGKTKRGRNAVERRVHSETDKIISVFGTRNAVAATEWADRCQGTKTN